MKEWIGENTDIRRGFAHDWFGRMVIRNGVRPGRLP